MARTATVAVAKQSRAGGAVREPKPTAEYWEYWEYCEYRESCEHCEYCEYLEGPHHGPVPARHCGPRAFTQRYVKPVRAFGSGPFISCLRAFRAHTHVMLRERVQLDAALDVPDLPFVSA